MRHEYECKNEVFKEEINQLKKKIEDSEIETKYLKEQLKIITEKKRNAVSSNNKIIQDLQEAIKREKDYSVRVQ
jgi:uncharacterized protein with ATP-grasp and redox domains